MSTPSIEHLTSSDFENRRLKRPGVWLVEFSAEWCPPCRALRPVLDALADQLAGQVGIGEVDGDAEIDLASRFGVRAYPSLLLFKEGEVVAQRIGGAPRKALEQWIAAA